MLRENFGNPFHPVTIDPACVIPERFDLARMIYDERTFEGMPMLAVALEDSGCDDAEILGHCRK